MSDQAERFQTRADEAEAIALELEHQKTSFDRAATVRWLRARALSWAENAAYWAQHIERDSLAPSAAQPQQPEGEGATAPSPGVSAEEFARQALAQVKESQDLMRRQAVALEGIAGVLLSGCVFVRSGEAR